MQLKVICGHMMQLKSTLVTSKPASLADPGVGLHGVIYIYIYIYIYRKGDSPVWSEK